MRKRAGETVRIGILFSGGKDSTNTLWYYREQAWDIACLLTLIPDNPDSYMFQQPHLALLTAQAAALELPLLTQRTPGAQDTELDDLRRLLLRAKAQLRIDGIAVGAVASDYQHERVTRICHEVGLRTFAPLWHKNPERLLREMIASGFDIRMTRIAADGLDESWLGRRLRDADIDRLVALNKSIGVHVGGEGGEYETITLDGPMFSHPVVIDAHVRVESPHRGEIVIVRVDA